MSIHLRLTLLVLLPVTSAAPCCAEIAITRTDPLAGEIPEDTELSADGTRLFASFFPANRVTGFDPSTLQRNTDFDIVAPTGIKALANGDLLVATAPWFQGVMLTGTPDPTLASQQGVWRIATNGATEQVATLPFENVLPNGIAVDAQGNTYVSNLIGNEIYRVDNTGELSVWLQDDLLSGDGSQDANSPSPGLSLGGNGLQFVDGELIVSNTDAGALFSISITPSGKPESIKTHFRSHQIIGIDGFEMASDGTVYGANLLTNELFSVSPTGGFSVLANFTDGIRAPAGVALSESSSELFFNNASFPFPFIADEFANQPGIGRLGIVPEPHLGRLIGFVILGTLLLNRAPNLGRPPQT